MKPKEKLKPCKCGSTDLYVWKYTQPDTYYRVCCRGCGWTGCVGHRKKDAINLWNELEPTGGEIYD